MCKRGVKSESLTLYKILVTVQCIDRLKEEKRRKTVRLLIPHRTLVTSDSKSLYVIQDFSPKTDETPFYRTPPVSSSFSGRVSHDIIRFLLRSDLTLDPFISPLLPSVSLHPVQTSVLGCLLYFEFRFSCQILLRTQKTESLIFFYRYDKGLYPFCSFFV